MRDWTIELHKLLAEGKGDDPEADEIREEMDGPWGSLTQLERDRLNRLSGDLYTITRPNSCRAPNYGPDMGEKILSFISPKVVDPDGLLDLLAKHPGCSPAGESAGLRYLAYEAMGDEKTAEIFRQHEAQIQAKLKAG